MLLRVFRTCDRRGKDAPPSKYARLVDTVDKIWGLEYIWEIEIHTIDEIMGLVHETNHPVIISDKGIEDEEDGPTIEIYDGYRE